MAYNRVKAQRPLFAKGKEREKKGELAKGNKSKRRLFSHRLFIERAGAGLARSLRVSIGEIPAGPSFYFGRLMDGCLNGMALDKSTVSEYGGGEN